MSTLYPNSSLLPEALRFYAAYWERKGLQGDAILLNQRVIITYPQSTCVYPAYLDIMRILQERENYKNLAKVYSEFQGFVDQYVTQSIPVEQKADAYLQAGIYAQVISQTTAARRAYTLAYQLAPTSDAAKKAAYYTGLSYLSERTYSGCSAALTQLNSVIAQYPKDPVATNSKFFVALAQHRAGDKDGALAGFKEFIDQNPESPFTPRALYLSGMSYLYNKHDYPTALAYFDRTIDWLTSRSPQGEDPKVVAGIEDRLAFGGLLYQSCDKKVGIYLTYYGLDSALAWGKELQTLFPKDRGMYQLGRFIPIAVLQWQGQWQDLLTASDELLAQFSQDTKKWVTIPAVTLMMKGYALENLGRDTEAMAVYEQIIKKYPLAEGTNALTRIAIHYENKKDIYSAISTYDRYIALCTDTAEIYRGYINKARLLATLERYTEAATILDGFLQQFDDRFDVGKDTFKNANALKLYYQIQAQLQIKPQELSPKEMKQLNGGNFWCYPCGNYRCTCVVCRQTVNCQTIPLCVGSYCICQNDECGESPSGTLVGCGCGNYCGCEDLCINNNYNTIWYHVYACGWSRSNQVDKTCGCAPAPLCGCCSGPKCGQYEGCVKVDLAAEDIFGGVIEPAECSTGAYVHFNVDNDNDSDNSVPNDKYPGADYYETGPVSGENDLKALVMTITPDLNIGTIELNISNANAKIWKNQGKGSSNLILAGPGTKTWNLANSSEKQEFNLWKYVEGVTKGESMIELRYRYTDGTLVSVDDVKYTFINANCGRQPRYNVWFERPWIEGPSFPPDFPIITRCEWSITEPQSLTEPPNTNYNCIAFTIGDYEHKYTQISDGDGYLGIDQRYGEWPWRGNGFWDFPEDIDAFYDFYGYETTASILDADIIYYSGFHAAKKKGCSCGSDSPWLMFESKIGTGIRIEHLVDQLNGLRYGFPVRFYKHK